MQHVRTKKGYAVSFVCMCVYMYVCVCICIGPAADAIHIHTHIQPCTHTYIQTKTRLCFYVCMHVLVPTST